MQDRAQQAVDFIASHCPSVGAFCGTNDPHLFLSETAAQMRAKKPTTAFPGRFIEHVAYAINAVASHSFLSPATALASVYLVTRFEFYFRVLSGKLNGDGTWVSTSAQQAAHAALGDQRLNKPRISSVALAYKVMRLGTSRAARYCGLLDLKICASPTTASQGFSIEDVGDRIEFGRHSVGHGQLGDISAEAIFYGLMTAVIFHAQE